jgi:hypothetical protein
MDKYVDDMLVKSAKSNDHIADLKETFPNPEKVWNEAQFGQMCLRGIVREVLGFMVSQQGIEANSEKVSAILEM